MFNSKWETEIASGYIGASHLFWRLYCYLNHAYNLHMLGCSSSTQPPIIPSQRATVEKFAVFACQENYFSSTKETERSKIKSQGFLTESLLYCLILKDISVPSSIQSQTLYLKSTPPCPIVVLLATESNPQSHLLVKEKSK